MVRSIAYRCPIGRMAFVALILLLFWGMASAETLTVCKSGCNYSSIQVAIDAAGPGDVIEVQSGVYYEALNITEQIILRGVDTGNGRPVIDAGMTKAGMTNVEMVDTGTMGTEMMGAEMMHAGMTDAGEKRSAVSINAYGCLLEGFRIENASETTGVYVASSNNIIRDNIIINCKEGIELDKSSYNTVTGNNISRNDENGIYLYASIGNTVTDNNVSYCRNGISLIRSIKNVLKNNTMSGCLQSFKVEEMFNNDIDTSNLVDGKPVYYLVDSFGSVIDSSSNAGTVYCINCRNITIRDLELMNNTYGIYIIDTSDSRIENNSARDCGIGILLVNSSHNTMLGNNISSSEGGIYLIVSNDNEVKDNSADHNENGIYLALSDNNALKNNTMSDNLRNFGIEPDLYTEIGKGLDNDIDTSNLVDGKPIYYMIGSFGSVINQSSNAGTVYCVSCNNITIRDLAISNNTYGIFFFDTRDSRIENNSIRDCQTGVSFFNSLNNTLQNNSITHNDHGIDLFYSGDNHLMNNTLNENRRSFRVEGRDQEGVLEDFDNQVDSSNLIDGKPIYYLVGVSDQVINSSSGAGTVYCISCDNITVRDLELINNSYGIYLLNTSNSRIVNNEITGNEDGIDLVLSDDNTIENNNVSLNEDGIDLIGSHDNRINGNSINYNRLSGGEGIHLISSSNNMLTDNNAIHNQYGILLDNSFHNMLRNNSLLENDYNFDLGVWARKDFDNDIDTSNLLDEKPIYYIRHAHDLDINSSSNAGAVYCIGCENITVRDLILNNSSHAVYFFDTDNSRIENITARYNRISILLHYSRNNAVTDNKASNNVDGIDIWMAEGNNIIGNRIDHNDDAGISLFESDYNNLSLNEITDSHNCILLWYSSDHNIVKNNNLAGKHADSLSVTKSDDNLITGNIARESFNGIVLEEADGNTIGDNDVNDNFNGHILINSSSNILSANHASRNIHGIAAYLSRDNIVAGNNASNNLDSGITFELVNNSSIKSNEVFRNSKGIVFQNSNRSQIDNSSIAENKVGISVYNSSEDIIARNNISGNFVGIYLFNSTNISLVNNSNHNNSFAELQRNLTLPQEALGGAVPGIIAEPSNLILYSPTHGGYSGETPPGEIQPEETAAIVSPAVPSQPTMPSYPTGGGDGGTGIGIPLQPEKPQPTDQLKAVDEALKYLREGRIIWNPPAEMELGRQETVVARITNDITVNLTEGLRGRGVPQPEQIINTSCYMQVDLYGDNFKITSLMPSVQPVSESGYTEWSWYVTPLKSGEQRLTLVATIILVIDNKDRSKGLEPHEQMITVTVSPQQTATEFFGKYWTWLAATIVIPIITWLWRSRLQKKS